MASELQIIARSKSSDPAQEALREAKMKWNLEVKKLINYLIACKQGINGRGNSTLGIPVSSIKDPLPPQIGQTLNEIASLFSSIMDDATKITDGQKYYSEHRRKPHAKNPSQSQQIIHSQIEPMLVAEASWAGSRAWAWISLLKKIDKQNRRLRLDMLGSGADILKSFTSFESEILNTKNPNSIPNAIIKLVKNSLDFFSVFLRNYDKLLSLYSSMEEKEITPKNKELPEKIIEEKPQLTDSSKIFERFQNIYDQLVKIEIVVRFLTTDENMIKFNTQSLRELYDAFSRDLTILYDLTQRTDHDKNAIELEKLTSDVIVKYRELLQLATTALGPANDFNELANKIPNPSVVSYIEIINNQEKIKKLAAGAINRWLHKNLLSINPSNLDRMRIEMAETSTKFRQQLDHLMDDLENREIGIKEISVKVAASCKILIDLIDQAISLSKNHMITPKTEKRELPISEIRVSDLRILREVKNNIEAYIKEK